MENTKIFIELPVEVLDFMSTNKISLEQEIQNAGIDAKLGHDQIHDGSENESRTKDVIPFIIYSAGIAIPALFYIILKIFDTIEADYKENIESRVELIRDDKGKIKINNGKPEYMVINKINVKEVARELSLEVDSMKKIKFSFKSTKQFR